jgi:hypothetical protein
MNGRAMSAREGHDLVKRHERDICNFYITPSRDTYNWDLTWVYAGQPMIPRGGDGSFDKDLLVPTSNIITHEDEHWIYYGGLRERHDRYPRSPGIGLAKLRLDGFVYLAAGEQEGTVLTKPLVISAKTGSEYGCQKRRGIRRDPGCGRQYHQRLRSEDAKPFINTQGVALEPRWSSQADFSTLKGKIVRLKFRLQKAKLYAFQVR